MHYRRLLAPCLAPLSAGTSTSFITFEVAYLIALLCIMIRFINQVGVPIVNLITVIYSFAFIEYELAMDLPRFDYLDLR